MDKQTFYYTLPMHGMSFKAECYSFIELKAKIQLYCSAYHVSDERSLALIIAGTGRDLGIGTPEEIKIKADDAYKYLPKVEGIIDLSAY